MAFLSGWNYRKAITLSNSATTDITDYQVKFRVIRSTGTDSGFNVYVGTKCESDYKDIRFASSDGTTLLGYWVETSASASADIWVKIPLIPASSTKTYYIYYGNQSATSASSGDSTFLFFDDFQGTSLNTTKWPSSRGAAVSNGVCTLDVQGSTGSEDMIFATGYTVPINSIFEARFTPESISRTCRFGASETETNFYEDGKRYLGIEVWAGDGYVYTNTNNAATKTQTREISGIPGFQTFKIVWTSPSVMKFYRNDVLVREYTSNVPSSSATLHPLFRDCMSIDWVIIRKYIATEPTVSSYGSEQLPITLTTTLLPDKSVRLSWT